MPNYDARVSPYSLSMPLSSKFSGQVFTGRTTWSGAPSRSLFILESSTMTQLLS